MPGWEHACILYRYICISTYSSAKHLLYTTCWRIIWRLVACSGWNIYQQRWIYTEFIFTYTKHITTSPYISYTYTFLHHIILYMVYVERNWLASDSMDFVRAPDALAQVARARIVARAVLRPTNRAHKSRHNENDDSLTIIFIYFIYLFCALYMFDHLNFFTCTEIYYVIICIYVYILYILDEASNWIWFFFLRWVMPHRSWNIRFVLRARDVG